MLGSLTIGRLSGGGLCIMSNCYNTGVTAYLGIHFVVRIT